MLNNYQEEFSILYIYQFAKLASNLDMKTINEIRRLNLMLLKKEFGTYANLAKLANTDPAYLSQILSTKTDRNMGDDLARSIEVACKKQTGWMDQDHNSIVASSEKSILEAGSSVQAKIPLINWVQAGQWREIMDTHEPEDWIDAVAHVTPRAYALRVIGDSMTNPHGAPSIPEGYIVIVEPDIVPVNGSIVVARLEHTNEAILKKLVYDGPKRYLKALNPAYQAIEIDDKCIICGVVKKVQYDL
ncbi:MAG: LexA family protein [Gammaproteobacteria bacterium]